MQSSTSERVVGDVMARVETVTDAARERCRRSKLMIEQADELLDRADRRIRDSYLRLADRHSTSPHAANYRAAAFPPDVV